MVRKEGFMFSRHTANHDVCPSGTIKLKTEMKATGLDWAETGLNSQGRVSR